MDRGTRDNRVVVNPFKLLPEGPIDCLMLDYPHTNLVRYRLLVTVCIVCFVVVVVVAERLWMSIE
jgi:hypothetical protein